MLVCSNLDEWMIFAADPRSYIKAHYKDSPTYRELADDLGTQISTVCDCVNRHKCSDLIKYSNLSYIESDICNFIQSLDSSIKIIKHDRHIIYPRELDIYLPEYRIAFECNPTATHNSSISDPWNGDPKPYNYHMMKTNMCEKAGIFLFHIFGPEWTHKSDIIKSMIRNFLSKNSDKIYARNTVVMEVPNKDCKKFLDENHRQGYTNSAIRLGLYQEDELVSLMTFNKKRYTIGPELSDNSYELVRFCSKLDTSVVGGADKLFKYFTRNYNPDSIISFSDRAHTRGNLYEKLGFNEIRRSDPGYVWVDSITDVAYHRMNAQKSNIKRFLHDDNIDLSQTEKEIMESHGYVSLYDSGTILWRWNHAAV